MATEFPAIGHWYRRPNGRLFEIVAIDDADGTLEIQYFDGTLGEIDLETWPDLILEPVDPPEDTSGSLDMDFDDDEPEGESGGRRDWLESLDYVE
ncbi:DUF6763 family protein [Lentisalinibacter sediminis]|uniref:DUF6763 family protein n=1 Tax=Lentisalinibacter sediminis TaxID=2992237 RepID=UPI0038690309